MVFVYGNKYFTIGFSVIRREMGLEYLKKYKFFAVFMSVEASVFMLGLKRPWPNPISANLTSVSALAVWSVSQWVSPSFALPFRAASVCIMNPVLLYQCVGHSTQRLFDKYISAVPPSQCRWSVFPPCQWKMCQRPALCRLNEIILSSVCGHKRSYI